MQDDYKSVCDKCFKKTWYEKEQPCPMTNYEGCKTCGSHEYIDKPVKCTGTLRVIDNSNLDERFHNYYRKGQRVQVAYKDGTKERFWVGKSTGWEPVYLAVKKTNSFGGDVIWSEQITEVWGLNKYK